MNRIRQLRNESHMTQLRLSIELEVSQETVSAYENQKHYPSFTQLMKLSSLFHASVDYIMGLSDVRCPEPPPQNDALGELVLLISRLDEKQVKLVKAYVQGILDVVEQLKADETP